MAESVSLEGMRSLPRLSQIALAARSAQRVVPLFTLPPRAPEAAAALQSISKSLSFVLAVLKGAPFAAGSARALSEEALHAGRLARELGPEGEASAVAAAVLSDAVGALDSADQLLANHTWQSVRNGPVAVAAAIGSDYPAAMTAAFKMAEGTAHYEFSLLRETSANLEVLLSLDPWPTGAPSGWTEVIARYHRYVNETARLMPNDLNALGPHAWSALAARCAERVAPSFALPGDHPDGRQHELAVATAIRHAKAMALGTPLSQEPGLPTASWRAYEASEAALDLESRVAPGSPSARAVRAAIDAAAAASRAADIGDRYEFDRGPEVLSTFAPILWSGGSMGLGVPARVAARSDLEWLLANVEPEQAVPASFFERPLWPAGEPVGLQEFLAEGRRLLGGLPLDDRATSASLLKALLGALEEAQLSQWSCLALVSRLAARVRPLYQVPPGTDGAKAWSAYADMAVEGSMLAAIDGRPQPVPSTGTWPALSPSGQHARRVLSMAAKLAAEHTASWHVVSEALDQTVRAFSQAESQSLPTTAWSTVRQVLDALQRAVLADLAWLTSHSAPAQTVANEFFDRPLWEEQPARTKPFDFKIAFDPALSPEEIRAALTELANCYRACGGLGLRVRFEESTAVVEFARER